MAGCGRTVPLEFEISHRMLRSGGACREESRKAEFACGREGGRSLGVDGPEGLAAFGVVVAGWYGAGRGPSFRSSMPFIVTYSGIGDSGR